MKTYLVFYDNLDGAREECNCMYSWVVEARSEADAIDKVAVQFDEDEAHLAAEEAIVVK
jgi:hypothetical protein